MRDKHSPKTRNQTAAMTKKGAAVKATDCVSRGKKVRGNNNLTDELTLVLVRTRRLKLVKDVHDVVKRTLARFEQEDQ